MTRIIIFAKAPLPGFAKTRLIPVLGPAGAAKIARRVLRRALGSAEGAAVGPGGVGGEAQIQKLATHGQHE